MNIEPAYEAFERTYQAGAPQLVWTRLIDDLETPAPPQNRENEAAKAKARSLERYGVRP